MNTDEYLVHWANVVVVARFHNPSILNPDFLRIHEIVPHDWKPSEVLTTRPVSFVQYDKNIRVSVDEQRFEVLQVIEAGFPDTSPIYQIASKYVALLEHVNYISLGFNWLITKKCENPGPWITSRFLKDGEWTEGEPELVRTEVTFSYKKNDSVCNLKLAPTFIEKPESLKGNRIELNCNFHHENKTTARTINSSIAQWKSKQEFVTNQLTRLLGSS